MLLLQCINNKSFIAHALINNKMLHRPMTMLRAIPIASPQQANRQVPHTAKIQHGEWKLTCGSPAQVPSPTPAHGNSKNESI